MDLAKLDINNTPHIGIYVALGNEYAIVPDMTSDSEIKVIEKIMNVKCLCHNISESQMNGVFAKIYNDKVLLSKNATKEDIKFFEKHNFKTFILDHYFAIGNLIVTNQKDVLVSKEIDSKTIKKIDEFLGVKTIPFSLGETPIGAVILVNNNGFAVSPCAKPADIKKLEKIFDVKGNIATINFGDSFIANGMLVNNHGIIVGKKTTGYELIRINDIFYN